MSKELLYNSPMVPDIHAIVDAAIKNSLDLNPDNDTSQQGYDGAVESAMNGDNGKVLRAQLDGMRKILLATMQEKGGSFRDVMNDFKYPGKSMENPSWVVNQGDFDQIDENKRRFDVAMRYKKG